MPPPGGAVCCRSKGGCELARQPLIAGASSQGGAGGFVGGARSQKMEVQGDPYGLLGQASPLLSQPEVRGAFVEPLAPSTLWPLVPRAPLAPSTGLG